MPDAEMLSAPLVLEYPFTRTVGPVQSAFLTGLREGVVLGVRGADGRVLCPPVEYDPVTSEELSELVEVGIPAGPCSPGRGNRRRGPPAARPALRLGARAAGRRRHRDAARPRRGVARAGLAPGCAVRIRWRDDREGAITDIACFEPDDGGGGARVE